MAKGEMKRIHKAFDGSDFIDLGPIKDIIPINNGAIPVDYGYIKNTLNKEEGDEVDVLIFTEQKLKTGDEVEITVIGMLDKEDGDHKIIAVDDKSDIEKISDISKEKWNLVEEFFSHKSPIVEILDKNSALEYLQSTNIL